MKSQESTPVVTTDSRDVLSRIAQGDAQALRTLFHEQGGLAMAVALRMLGSRAEAEAVVIETFLTVARTARAQAPRGNGMSAWIAGLAHDRARQRLLARRSGQDVAVAASGPEPLPLESARRRGERKAVAAALSLLPVAQRQVLELAWFECLSIRGIAARIGETEHAVAMRMTSALDRLAAVLPADTEKSA